MAQDVLGQNHIEKHFENAIKAGKISHAYIINGEKGTGKMMIANRFAKALQCEQNRPEKETKSGKTCENCQSCKQADSKNQPDIKYVTFEKKSLGVDDIRFQINDDVEIKPYSSAYKIYIIPECEKMTIQAQNALLKTIEEPPEYAVFILLTTNADLFLPTILSRCVLMNIRPVKEDEMIETLKSKCGVGEYDAKVAVSFAGGNIGKAKALLTSEQFAETKKRAVGLVGDIREGGMDIIAAKIKDFSDYKDDKEGFRELLDIIRMCYADVLKYKATKNEKDIIFQDSMNEIKQLANEISYENLDQIMKLIDETENRSNSNVGFETNFEVLLLGIKERIM